jgi:hypothetical protein
LADASGNPRLADPDRLGQLPDRHGTAAQRRQHRHMSWLQWQSGIRNRAHRASLHSLGQPLQPAAEKRGPHVGNYVTHAILHTTLYNVVWIL